MGRPKDKRWAHLPKHVTVIQGAYWCREPGAKPVRIGNYPQDEALVWEFEKRRFSNNDSPLKTLDDCFEKYKRDILPLLAPNTQREYHRHLLNLSAEFGGFSPDFVTPRRVGAYLDKLDRGKIALNREIATLSAVYALCVRKWHCATSNPCTGLMRNQQSKSEQKRKRYISNEEWDAFLPLCSDRIRIAFKLALLTGQRQGDLLSLTMAQIKADGILFRQNKTGAKLCIGWTDELQEVVEEAKQLQPQGPYLIRTDEGTRYSQSGFIAGWKRAMEKALKLGVISEKFTFRDVRAKAVSDAPTLEEAFIRAGHSSINVTKNFYDRGVRIVKAARLPPRNKNEITENKNAA